MLRFLLWLLNYNLSLAIWLLRQATRVSCPKSLQLCVATRTRSDSIVVLKLDSRLTLQLDLVRPPTSTGGLLTWSYLLSVHWRMSDGSGKVGVGSGADTPRARGPAMTPFTSNTPAGEA